MSLVEKFAHAAARNTTTYTAWIPNPRWISRQKTGCRKKSIQASQYRVGRYGWTTVAALSVTRTSLATSAASAPSAEPRAGPSGRAARTGRAAPGSLPDGCGLGRAEQEDPGGVGGEGHRQHHEQHVYDDRDELGDQQPGPPDRAHQQVAERPRGGLARDGVARHDGHRDRQEDRQHERQRGRR